MEFFFERSGCDLIFVYIFDHLFIFGGVLLLKYAIFFINFPMELLLEVGVLEVFKELEFGKQVVLGRINGMVYSLVQPGRQLGKQSTWQLNTSVKGADKSKTVYRQSEPRLPEQTHVIFHIFLERSSKDHSDSSTKRSKHVLGFFHLNVLIDLFRVVSIKVVSFLDESHESLSARD